MSQCKTDLEGNIFVKSVDGIPLEAWIVVVVFVFILIYKELIFAAIVYIYIVLFGFFQLVIELSCVLRTHAVSAAVPIYIRNQRGIGRMTALELAVNPLC